MPPVPDTDSAWPWAFDIEALGAAAIPMSHVAYGDQVLGSAAWPARFDNTAALANGKIVVATSPRARSPGFLPSGANVCEVKMPDVHPTDICFGGADMKTAHITLQDRGQHDP